MFLKSLYIFMLSLGTCWNYGLVQNYYWRPYSHGYLPLDAYEAAPGKFIGLVCHPRGELVATIYPDSRAIVAVQDNKITLDNTNGVKIMCTSTSEKFYWENVNFTIAKTEVMNHAVQAGYHEGYKSHVFIGKVYDLDEWKIGLVVPVDAKDNKGLWIWNEIGWKKNALVFDLLKYNDMFQPIPNATKFPV